MFTKLTPAAQAGGPAAIGYMQAESPAFTQPPVRGERYERLVPDTLDLQDRASLAINGLTAPTDPDADYEIYWILFPRARPPVMEHAWCDACQAKYMEALPLMRLISGSALNEHVERRWMETTLQMQGPDGLLYYPKIGRPWGEIQVFGVPTPGDHYFTIYFGGRMLNVITLMYLRGGEQVWLDTGRRYVDGLANLVVDDGRYASFVWPQYGPDGALPPDIDPDFPPAYGMANWTAPVVAGLTYFYRATKYEPALVLAGKLARWIVEKSRHFEDDGTFVHEPVPPQAEFAEAAGGDGRSASYAHFHGHTITLLGLLEYATATNDAAILDFVVRGYLYARAQGNPMLGYFPEVVGRSGYEYCETCCVADMVSLALKLSVAGAGDYWDDADRWLRNQLVENQMTKADWTWRLWEMGSAHPRDFDLRPSTFDSSHESIDRAMERNVGGFAAHSAPNDLSNGRSGITACCTGNGARTLYHAWENILSHADGTLRINLLLNRASPWADVDSYVPYEGRVDVRMRQAAEVEIRIPEWVRPQEARVEVDGTARTLRWDGRYARIGAVEAGQIATLTFPIRERTDETYVEKHAYTVVRKGNEVVSIDPPGRYSPLYQRDHYRNVQARWRTIERFVSDESIDW